MSPGTELCHKEDVDRLYAEIKATQPQPLEAQPS
jgi:hypothetical protein